MKKLHDLTEGAAQNVLCHLDPWGRTQAALAIKPWSRLGTLPARKLVLVGSQFDATLQCLAQLAAAAPQAQELQLHLDAATQEGTVPAILECLGGRSSLTSLLVAEVTHPQFVPSTAPMWGPSLHHLAPHLTSFTLHLNSRGTGADDLRCLLSCQHLAHLKLGDASIAPNGCNLYGLDAAGVLVVAQLHPLTSAELQLHVEDKMTLKQLLAMPAVAPVAEEVLRVQEEFGGPLMRAALQVFKHRHGPTLRQLTLAGCVRGGIIWAGPWDMPRLERYRGDSYIQLEFKEDAAPASCRSSLTSLQLTQGMSPEVWEMLPQRLPKLQLLDVHDVCYRNELETHAAAGFHSLGALDALQTLRWCCVAHTAFSASAHLTQLRSLELVAQYANEAPVDVRLEALCDLGHLTRLCISGPCNWKVEERSWQGLAGKLPQLRDLHVTAIMAGHISQLPGTGLQALYLESISPMQNACSYSLLVEERNGWFLQLVGAVLPSSLTRLQLKMVQVVDTPVKPANIATAKLQAWQQGFPWLALPLQLPQLRELWLSGVSTWMPAAAFSASPITSLRLLAGLPDFARPQAGRQLDLQPYCQALPLLRELHVDMSTGHKGLLCSQGAADPEPLPDLAPFTRLSQLACLRLVAPSFAQITASPDGAPLGHILQQLLQLTRLELLEKGSSNTHIQQRDRAGRRGCLRQALKACRSLRVAQLQPPIMWWAGPGDNEPGVPSDRDRDQLWGNCVVLNFEKPLCGQL